MFCYIEAAIAFLPLIAAAWAVNFTLRGMEDKRLGKRLRRKSICLLLLTGVIVAGVKLMTCGG